MEPVLTESFASLAGDHCEERLVALALKLLRRDGEKAARLIRARIAKGKNVTAKGAVLSVSVLKKTLLSWGSSGVE